MSSVPTVSQIPNSVLDTVTQTNLTNSGASVPTTAVWQTPVTAPTSIATVTPVSTAIVVPGSGSPDGIPTYVGALAATEAPYKNKNGQMFTAVSVTFIPPVDVNWAAVQIWFSGYNGNPYPQLMTTGSVSPLSFLVETTGETVTITANSVSPQGLQPLFTGAPTTTLTLNGVAGQPPSPSIANSLSVTPTGYQFQFNYISGLSADVIMSYNIYKNSVNSYPGPSSGFVKSVNQPSNLTANPSATGVYTYQETVPLGTTDYYWVTSVNQLGTESAPTSAGTTTSITPIDANGNLQLKNILTANQGTANLSFPATAAQLGTNTITATFKGNPVLILFHANVILATTGSTSLSGGAFFLYRDGSLVNGNAICTCNVKTGAGTSITFTSTSSLSYLDNPTAGSHQYQIFALEASSLDQGAINWSEFQVIELG